MKILFLTPRFPYPPIKGEQLRAFNFIKYLSSKGHKVVLLSIYSQKDLTDRKGIEKYCEEICCIKVGLFEKIINFFRMIIFGLPLQNFPFYSLSMKKKITELKVKHKFDIVQIELIRMAQYIPEFKGIDVIWDLVDSLSLNMRRRYEKESLLLKPIFYYEWKTMKRYEKKVTSNNHRFLVVSEAEKQSIGSSKIEIVPVGVSMPQISFDLKKIPNKIVFSGNLEYFPNIYAVLFFVNKIFPLIKSKVSDATFFIVGASPVMKIKSLHNGKDIIVTGYVKNIYDQIASAACSVVPTCSGTSVQIKILEAMICKVPVVATSYVLSDAKFIPNKHLLIEDAPQKFADAVVSLLQEKALSDKLTKEAFDFVAYNYNWDNICGKIYDKYKE